MDTDSHFEAEHLQVVPMAADTESKLFILSANIIVSKSSFQLIQLKRTFFKK